MEKAIKKAQYTVNRTDDLSDMKEKLKVYLTEHEYQEYTQDSMFPSILEAAKDQDCQIKLKKIMFTPSDESDDRIEFNYEMVIQFIDQKKEKSKKEIEKKKSHDCHQNRIWFKKSAEIGMGDYTLLTTNPHSKVVLNENGFFFFDS
ncbi:hypothetical protein BsIDN1_65020 [Bacillus safensis]|uniref:Uncharacterized protein n=1 Tax=Bacillus safensis TaxID=561879 RepID=A0A5S9MKX8_BACIA|nr:hypothetical protein BsIDN1_65020 [Bacillus safensis]